MNNEPGTMTRARRSTKRSRRGLLGRVGLALLAMLLLATCGTPQAVEETKTTTDPPPGTLPATPPTPLPTAAVETPLKGTGKTVRPTATLVTLPATPTSNPSAEMAPDFLLPDLEGQTWTLSQFQGQPVMLFFWATW